MEATSVPVAVLCRAATRVDSHPHPSRPPSTPLPVVLLTETALTSP
jgi:hypothetical protein